MKKSSIILSVFLLGILSLLICCGEGSDDNDHNTPVPNNEDMDEDPDNPIDPDMTGTYPVPQLEIPASDQSRLLGEGADEIENEIENVASAGAAQSIRSLMSPVCDQKERYTASAFAAMALIEEKDLDFSEQCLIYFSGGNDQTLLWDFLEYIISHGVFYESSCPYGNDPSAIPADLSSGDIDISFDIYQMSYGEPSITGIREVKKHLDRGRPIALRLWVSSEEWYSEAEVIQHPESEADNLCAQSSTCGVHTVVFTGYDDVERVLEFKNSWGTAWKDNGYGKLTYEYFLKNYVSGSDNPLFTVEPG